MNISKKETDGKVNVIAKPQDLWLTIKKLLECMKKSSLLIVLTIVIAIGGTVMQVISPKLLGKATTLIFYGIKTQSGIDFNGLILILLSVAVMYLGVFISSFLQERIMTVVAQKNNLCAS
ncbi:ABC-type multidrug transport system fused ATPase/permease subunit [Clostridium beijerinckii]|uniref:hypothetical protein n=1 Tax=Clostridium beijerinckii TaxID=1520 RepID=UPI0020C6284D|nr:hypothetical protein [Clostridium beijerinckii]NRZ86212.1 ABC-type multidrug transport system fused ATPase/permease subunit [Clostridium beijerinckii]